MAVSSESKIKFQIPQHRLLLWRLHPFLFGSGVLVICHGVRSTEVQ